MDFNPTATPVRALPLGEIHIHACSPSPCPISPGPRLTAGRSSPISISPSAPSAPASSAATASARPRCCKLIAGELRPQSGSDRRRRPHRRAAPERSGRRRTRRSPTCSARRDALAVLAPRRSAARRAPTSWPTPTGRWKRGSRPRSAASASTPRRHAACDALRRPAHARRRSPRWSSPSPISCCSTSRPTISTAKAARPSIDLLAGWRAGAIVVSHDRELLETMDAIVELTSLGATRYGGNWSAYRERKALELAAARARSRRRREARRRRRAHAPRQPPSGKARKDSAGHDARPREGDMPRILLGAHEGPSRGHRRRERPPRRTPPRRGAGRRRRSARAHRDPAAALGRRCRRPACPPARRCCESTA